LEKHRLPDTPFWVDPESVASDHLTLSATESHHLLRVHRAREGTPFEAIDGQGNLYRCSVRSVERRVVIGKILDRAGDVGELGRPFEIIVGMPDWGPVEQIVEHGVPLGVSLFDFVPCERSTHIVLGEQRLARLDRIARAGLKQSRRTRLPALRSSASLDRAVAAGAEGTRLVADPDGPVAGAGSVGTAQGAISLAVGPPGGFTPEEHDFLRGQGFQPISLGPSRLTTETASIALISVVRNILQSSELPPH
jgi:16S rRNA (uracil1498-N3)-methyltransferase